MQRIPDGVLSRHKDVRGRGSHDEMGTRVNAEFAATDDAVDEIFKGLQVGGFNRFLDGGIVAPSLRGKCVQVASQAGLVLVVYTVRWLSPIDEELVGDVVHGPGHALERARHDAATAGAMRKRQGGCEINGVVVGEVAVTRHGVLGAVEDWRPAQVVGRGGPVPVGERSRVTTGVSQILLKHMQEHSVPDQEETVQVDDAGPVDVNDGIVEEAVDGSGVHIRVQLGGLISYAVDGVGVCLSFCGLHRVKVFSDLDVGLGAGLVLSGAFVLEPFVDDGEVCGG